MPINRLTCAPAPGWLASHPGEPQPVLAPPSFESLGCYSDSSRLAASTGVSEGFGPARRFVHRSRSAAGKFTQGAASDHPESPPSIGRNRGPLW